MVAYDYDAQRWIGGPEAVALAAKQAAEVAPLLKDPAYLAFIANNHSTEDRDQDHGCSHCGDDCNGLCEAAALAGDI
jgi:hypothetical protein